MKFHSAEMIWGSVSVQKCSIPCRALLRICSNVFFNGTLFEKKLYFFVPARKEAFRGARTLETGLIDSTDRVDAI